MMVEKRWELTWLSPEHGLVGFAGTLWSRAKCRGRTKRCEGCHKDIESGMYAYRPMRDGKRNGCFYYRYVRFCVECIKPGEPELLVYPMPFMYEHRATNEAKEWAEKVGIPLHKWPGRCYKIAVAVCNAGLVPGGKPVYGHWRGYVTPECVVQSFHTSRYSSGFCRHGWIWVEDEGKVVDPTRWVFEGLRPQIIRQDDPNVNSLCRVCYCGHVEDEHESGFFSPCTVCGENEDGEHICPDFDEDKPEWPYDEGGQTLRKALLTPCPPFSAEKGTFDLDGILDMGPAVHVRTLVENMEREYGLMQLHWLANLPMDTLGPHALPIFKALQKLNLGGFIPIDNLHKAEREAA